MRSLLDPRHTEYVPVHEAAIKDVHFSPRGDGLVLTAGMDKTLRITSVQSNCVVQTYVGSAA